MCGIAWSEPSDATRPPAVVHFQLPESNPRAAEYRIIGKCAAHKSSDPPASIARIIDRVKKHLGGDLQDFADVLLDFSGHGSFSQAVYRAARKIPAGQTITYGQLAGKIKRPNAARAVGQALGSNPIALIIPCHRILAVGNKVGGFSAHGGVATKSRLLCIEGAAAASLFA
jgi:methylated-DNA-[protein]-cysteine S-methyltransferase